MPILKISQMACFSIQLLIQEDTPVSSQYLYSCKDIVLRRNTAGSLGFSIVGGYEENSGNKPFFIKSIVGGTPAYNDGRIRCGDILLAVNGRNISGMVHANLARMLKELKGKITLTIASWPGTFL
uniref:E3 ubiquitin-protein ligase LNX n=1 Tax=Sphaerodactylus townsendi TaxID=933632 RepID=A0ACB8E849_9SAUR